jgi:hypothetical protein
LDAARDARAELADTRSELSAVKEQFGTATRRLQKAERDNEGLRRIESNLTGFYRSVVSSDGRGNTSGGLPPLPPTPSTASAPMLPFSSHGLLPSVSEAPPSSSGGFVASFAASRDGAHFSSGSPAAQGSTTQGFPPIASAPPNPRDAIARTSKYLQRREEMNRAAPGSGSSPRPDGPSDALSLLGGLPVPPAPDDLVDDPGYIAPTVLQQHYRQRIEASKAQAALALQAADGFMSTPVVTDSRASAAAPSRRVSAEQHSESLIGAALRQTKSYAGLGGTAIDADSRAAEKSAAADKQRRRAARERERAHEHGDGSFVISDDEADAERVTASRSGRRVVSAGSESARVVDVMPTNRRVAKGAQSDGRTRSRSKHS